MKKLVAILLLSLGAMAEAQAQSILRVSLTDNSIINVSVDGRYFNRRGTSVTIGDLPYGIHMLKIYTYPPQTRGGYYQQVVYRGKITTYQGMATDLVYDPWTRTITTRETDMYSRPLTNVTPTRPGTGKGVDRYDSRTDTYVPQGNNDQMSNNQTDAANNRAIDTGYDNIEHFADGGNNEPVASPVSSEMSTLTDADAGKLKKKIAALPADLQKLKELKEQLKNEKILTQQIGEIMDWFLFENSKVDFAKWAFAIAIDKEYYPDLLDKCTLKDTQDDFQRFLKEKGL